MSNATLQSQANNITQSNGGYNFNVNGILQWYSSVYQLLFQYYANQYLFDRETSLGQNIQTLVTNLYTTCKALASPTVIQSNFISDYEYFVS
jgi:hypothetical protein